MLLLIDRNLPGAQAAAGLLFPVAVWLSVIGWRAMNGSGRLAVRAAADIAVALLLGSTLVLLLVWLANLLHMPPAEVRVLRGALGRAGAAVDLPWWLWTALFALLAGASLAFAVWPGRLKRVTGWFARLRVAPSVTVTSRVTSGAHIGLLVVVLVGLAAPAAVEPALRARLADRYTETLTDDLRARGELAAYRETQRAFSAAGLPLLVPLADLVLQIHRASKPRDIRSGRPAWSSTWPGGWASWRRSRWPCTRRTSRRPRRPSPGGPAWTSPRPAGRPERAASPARLRTEGRRRHRTPGGPGRRAGRRRRGPGPAAARSRGLRDRSGDQGVPQQPYRGQPAEGRLRRLGRTARRPRRASGGRGGRRPRPGPAEGRRPRRGRRELARTPVTDPAEIVRLAGEAGLTAAVDLANQVRYLQEGNGPATAAPGRKRPAAGTAPGITPSNRGRSSVNGAGRGAPEAGAGAIAMVPPRVNTATRTGMATA